MNLIELLIVAAAKEYLHRTRIWSTGNPATLCAAVIVNIAHGGP